MTMPSSLSDDAKQPTIPNAARIYNYTLGGSFYYPVDQAAAEYMFSLVPSTQKWVRMLRAFLHHAARQLADDGFTHVIDFASGIPTEDHIHTQLPRARIIYSDIDPDTYALAQKLVGELPNVRYFQHDVREPLALLESPAVRDFLQGERRVAFGLSGVSAFLTAGELRHVFHELYSWAAPGSCLYITYETKQPDRMTPRMEQFLAMFEQAGSPFYLYTREECIALSQPWQLPSTGLVSLHTFLGLPSDYITEDDREGVGLEFYAAILEKPAAGAEKMSV
jgi:hypothetical protein